MFKVPEWSSDVPKSNVEAMKLFTKKNKRKENTKTDSPLKIKSNVLSRKPNHNKKNVNSLKSTTNRKNGHTRLSKDDHINNRILRRNLKMTSADVKNHHKTEIENSPGQSTQKGMHKTLNNKINVKNKLKNKLLKRNCKVSKPASNDELNETEKSNKTSLNEINENLATNVIDKPPKSLKRRQALNDTTHTDVKLKNVPSLTTDEPNIILLNSIRKKLNKKIKNDGKVDILFGNNNCNGEEHLIKENVVFHGKQKIIQKKKTILKEMLKTNRNVIKTNSNNSNNLRERMLERLKAAQFRYLNEKLYTSSGSESQELFKSDPAAFQTYHEGYQLQVKKWPVNPLDLIVKRILKMPKTHLIADMGCGEAALSKRVVQSVRSFDLVATAPGVEACNMAHTPLLAASVDAVVFCLALMGTDLTQYLLEANRVLKIGGHLLIAEVESRFDNVDTFSNDVQRLGFSLKKLDKSHQVFFFMEFTKARDAPAKRNKLPTLSLKPCLYKRR